MIGIIPAAGKAERMHGLPKMLLPIPGGDLLVDRIVRQMQTVELTELVLGASLQTRIDLMNRFRKARAPNAITETMSQTVLLCVRTYTEYPSTIFAMPDTYIEDEQAFVKLARCLDDGAQVAVGVFHAREGQHTEGGMVIPKFVSLAFAMASKGEQPIIPMVTEIIDKPTERVSDWIWGCLAWKPEFWQHIHADDPHVGFGVQRAVEAGLDVRAVKMDGGFWDCGTPERYFRLVNHLTQGG